MQFRRIFLILCFTLFIPAQAFALFEQGTFEGAAPWTGWTMEYSVYNGNFTFNWMPLGTRLPQPYIRIAAQPVIIPTTLDVEPYEGLQTAVINDIEQGTRGGQDATRISQTDFLTQADKDAGCLHVTWGALLEYADNHLDGEQAYFEINLIIAGLVVESFQANSNDAVVPNSGWTNVGGNFWYRRGDVSFDLRSYPVGTAVTIEMLVTDCSLGVHAGMAFLDNVQMEPCSCIPPTPETICDNPCAVTAPLSHSVYPSAMNGASNPFLIYIRNATDVDFYVWNQWGEEVYDYHTSDVNGLRDPGQDYFTLKWYGAKNGGGTVINNDVYVQRVDMSNCGGSLTAGPASLTVLGVSSMVYPSVDIDAFTGPTISVHPSFIILREGGAATFSVTATGAGPLTYRWRKNGVPLFDGPSAGGGTISGAYTSTLTIDPAFRADAGDYDVVVTNVCCTSTTSTSAGMLFTAILITSQPQDIVVPLGGTATFTVIAEDSLSATPLWYVWCNWTVCFGEHTSTFTIDNVQESDYGKYDVEVLSEHGSVTSRKAQLLRPPGPAVPALSPWGLGILVLAMFAAGRIMMRRRRPQD